MDPIGARTRLPSSNRSMFDPNKLKRHTRHYTTKRVCRILTKVICLSVGFNYSLSFNEVALSDNSVYYCTTCIIPKFLIVNGEQEPNVMILVALVGGGRPVATLSNTDGKQVPNAMHLVLFMERSAGRYIVKHTWQTRTQCYTICCLCRGGLSLLYIYIYIYTHTHPHTYFTLPRMIWLHDFLHL